MLPLPPPVFDHGKDLTRAVAFFLHVLARRQDPGTSHITQKKLVTLKYAFRLFETECPRLSVGRRVEQEFRLYTKLRTPLQMPRDVDHSSSFKGHPRYAAVVPGVPRAFAVCRSSQDQPSQ